MLSTAISTHPIHYIKTQIFICKSRDLNASSLPPPLFKLLYQLFLHYLCLSPLDLISLLHWITIHTSLFVLDHLFYWVPFFLSFLSPFESTASYLIPVIYTLPQPPNQALGCGVRIVKARAILKSSSHATRTLYVTCLNLNFVHHTPTPGKICSGAKIWCCLSRPSLHSDGP